MKKNNLSRLWRFVFIGIVSLYIIVVIFFVRSLIGIPKDYSRVQAEQRVQIKQLLETAIDANDTKKYQEIENEHAVEFIVMDSKKKVVYSTVGISSDFDFKKKLNEKAVSSEEYFPYYNEKGNYSVWLLQYYLSPQTTFDNWSLSMFISVALLVSLNFLVVVILFTKFIRPLERLRDNVYKISKYQLDLISTNNFNEYDQISQQLVYFAKNLEGYIDNSIVEYTTLEKNLQIQNERLEYKNKQVAELTHNLKGPINIISMQTNNIIDGKDKNTLKTIKDINDSSKQLIGDINEIGHIVYKDNHDVKLEEVNLIALILDTIAIYDAKIEAKKLELDLIVDDEMKFVGNVYSLKQIINNAVSNICAYTPEKGQVIIEGYLDKNILKLNFYNDSKQFNEEQLSNIFKLFFRYADDDEGTGTGLYTIKRLVEEMEGVVAFVNKGNGIELQIKIEVDNHE